MQRIYQLVVFGGVVIAVHAHHAKLCNEGVTGNLMRYLRLVLTAGVLFGACSCSEVGGDLSVSMPQQIRCQAGPESPGESRTLVVTITKNPTSQPGTYEIDFIGKCSSIFSCIPSDAESRTRFANFVLTAN
jgi:hypothetical protein